MGMFMGIIDIACMAISWIPGLDLLGWPMKIFGEITLNFYFLIKLGGKYFGGKRSAQKIATTFLNGVVAAIPAIDDFIPSLSIQLWSMYWLLDKEAKDEEHEAAAKAANDAVKQARLSQAA